MALSLDSTVGGANANSLVSVEFADAYFEGDILRSDRWSALDSDAKKKALISSTRSFRGLTLWGEPASETQSLPFPRILTGVSDGTSNPQEIAEACCLHALDQAEKLASYSASEKRMRMRRDGVTSFRIGDMGESLAPMNTGASETDNTQFSSHVRWLIEDWVRRGFAVDSGRRPSRPLLWWPTELTS
jgi:DnaT-like ssDNA binding protein